MLKRIISTCLEVAMSKRNRILLTIIAVFSLASLTGCGFVADGPVGWAYTHSKTAVAVGTAKTGSRTGQACVTSYLGMWTVGDASIDAAMKAAGIKEVYTVYSENLSILGTYTRKCTVVTGETEIASAEPEKKAEEPAKTSKEPAKTSKEPAKKAEVVSGEPPKDIVKMAIQETKSLLDSEGIQYRDIKLKIARKDLLTEKDKANGITEKWSLNFHYLMRPLSISKWEETNASKWKETHVSYCAERRNGNLTISSRQTGCREASDEEWLEWTR